MKGSRKCEMCGSRWPALVTPEAFNNRQRMRDIHPGKRCKDQEGEFGPQVAELEIEGL